MTVKEEIEIWTTRLESIGFHKWVSLQDFDTEIFEFHSPDADTNLHLSTDDGRIWRLSDGRPSVDNEFWRGQLKDLKHVVSLLILVGRNGFYSE